ncbi:MAG: polyprenyl synthetase family protein [Candidatus Bathyarchaeia archaeon]|jgi:geranylgeranyl pyrophosphate synthase|nr:polyprenyl synthetase family protein [Candidatus Bathyarchaeota archaeon A05DMB-4]MDH7594703.1 polyprenyl synthetase family protein [Candidatus Bathyarchaeota archaeon]
MPVSKVYVVPNEEAFRVYVAKTKQIIESELSVLISRLSNLRFHEKIKYALLSQGKRLRPLLVMLSAQSVGGNREKVTSLALAIELLHTATLVHDDILDQDKFRRDVLTVHEKWSVSDAILVGDAMIALAIYLAADYGKEALKITSRAGLALCDGEYMDVSIKSLQMSEDEYLEKIRKKSASLFKAAAHCGAIAGGGSDFEVECLADFGEHFGMAYQLSDDLSDVTSLNDGIPKDLGKRRISLPLIHLYKSSSPSERKILLGDLQILSRKKDGAKKLALTRVLKNLKTKGSLDYCKKEINKYIDKSIQSIQSLKNTDFKYYLAQMAESLRPKEEQAKT